MKLAESTAPAGTERGTVPRIAVKNLSFSYDGKPLFENLNFAIGGEGAGEDAGICPDPGISLAANPGFFLTANPGFFLAENPLVILGPSGCGKTTLLKLMAGLLHPDRGAFEGVPRTGGCSFVFQEPRLLPWKTVLANVTLPAEPVLGKVEAEERARHFLRQVSLEDKSAAYPGELSGGQKQRVSFARAFTFPGAILLMDEPFQSLDIPLRIQLMDLTRSLLEESPRRTVIVTHDPREAVYLGKRIMVLGKAPAGFVFDETLELAAGEWLFGSETQRRMEARLTGILSGLCQ
jgi:NitT/TauT family transport system ATP-binding protein